MQDGTTFFIAFGVGCAGKSSTSGTQQDSVFDSDASVYPDTTQPGSDSWDAFTPPPPPETCALTVSDIEGPYYLNDIPIRADLDIYDEAAQKIIVCGYVCDSRCRPIPYAVIEVWHADSQGEYDLTSDEKKYYAQLAADENGFYRFKSILPGAYATQPDDFRPRHYHVKIWIEGEEKLTTQLYFEGDDFLDYEPDTPTSLMLDVGTESPSIGRFDFVLR